MLIMQSDSDKTLPLTPVSSLGSPDTVTINMAMSAEKPAVTNPVPNQAMTSPKTCY